MRTVHEPHHSNSTDVPTHPYKHFAPPKLITDNSNINRAFRIAMGDIEGNITTYKGGVLKRAVPCLMAGLDYYDMPWTRDSSINTWNGVGLTHPTVAKHNLLSVLITNSDKKLIVGGEYWDAVIWAIGAWELYLYSGDLSFLALALQVTRNTLQHFETDEWDTTYSLFRGPAVFMDGVAAYPKMYAQTKGSSAILDWPACNPKQRVPPPSYGIPMHALSTNCVYYQAYVLAGRMIAELRKHYSAETILVTEFMDQGLIDQSLIVDISGDLIDVELEDGSVVQTEASLHAKAQALKQSINKNFWNEANGCYNYLIDQYETCTHQEGIGHSFAILFGIASKEQRDSIFSKMYIAPAGIPCLWPNYKRYEKAGGFGRQAGTVWPHVQAFWSHAASLHGHTDKFEYEITQLTSEVNRDNQFAEVYHPVTGVIYGGLQEGFNGNPNISLWTSCSRQTWSASGYLRMITMCLFGMRFEVHGVTFHPHMISSIQQASLTNLPYREMSIDAEVMQLQSEQGPRVLVLLNGKEVDKAFIPAHARGKQKITIILLVKPNDSNNSN